MKIEMLKPIIYIISFFLSLVALDSVNINNIFKKNNVYKARLFFFMLAIALSYLVSNFIFELISLK